MILQNNQKGDIMMPMNDQVMKCVYRISVKALITDADGRFLLCKEENGLWELPGGGLEYDENPQDALAREIKEEMGLTVTSIEEHPSYFVTSLHPQPPHRANVIYRTGLENLEFIPSDECVEIRFFSAARLLKEKNVYKNVTEFAKQYLAHIS